MSERERLHARRMETLGRLAGGIAHDFNNLLTSIRGLSSLALQDLSEDDPLRADMEQIENAAIRATAMTQMLLGLGRRNAPRPVPTSPADAISEFQTTLRRTLAESTTLHVESQPDTPAVSVDPGRLRQLLLGICIYAEDAATEPVTIDIRTEAGPPGHATVGLTIEPLALAPDALAEAVGLGAADGDGRFAMPDHPGSTVRIDSSGRRAGVDIVMPLAGTG